MISNESRMPAAFRHRHKRSTLPAGQAAAAAMAPIPPSVACPACGHCPSLPSGESAYAFITGQPGSFLTVLRDMILRGVLIWSGIWTYDKFVGRENPFRLQQSVAGAAGIEFFVIGWTWWKLRTSNQDNSQWVIQQVQPAQSPQAQIQSAPTS